MLLKTYLAFGIATCLWFAVAAAAGWKAPNLGIVDGMSGSGGGRGYGFYYSSGFRGGK